MFKIGQQHICEAKFPLHIISLGHVCITTLNDNLLRKCAVDQLWTYRHSKTIFSMLVLYQLKMSFSIAPGVVYCIYMEERVYMYNIPRDHQCSLLGVWVVESQMQGTNNKESNTVIQIDLKHSLSPPHVHQSLFLITCDVNRFQIWIMHKYYQVSKITTLILMILGTFPYYAEQVLCVLW